MSDKYWEAQWLISEAHDALPWVTLLSADNVVLARGRFGSVLNVKTSGTAVVVRVSNCGFGVQVPFV